MLAWDLVSPARRTAGTLGRHPDHGDRVQHLVFTGPDLDRDRLLGSCLLTEAEERAGAAVRAGYDDPFAPVLDVKEAA